MKNVTITLDERTAAWARVEAAQRGMSVSRMVGEMLRERMRCDRDYETAMRRWFARKLVPLKGPGQRYSTREELHDRAGLR